MPNQFSGFASTPNSLNWSRLVHRDVDLYSREGDLRSEFERDYTRILHSKGFRRLKHKTQVFFATQHDHVCTRMEHVTHVASISNTIARNLGLNDALTNAIASGHDIGHAPFGHHGEQVLKFLCKKHIGDRVFWHEKNSLNFVDNIETLQDLKGFHINLSLTYAVRDGIICHCGEIDESALFPRKDPIDLWTIIEPGKIQPFTWEGCVVKVSDKIAYLGRDIEDALLYRILDYQQFRELKKIVSDCVGHAADAREVNNTVIISDLVSDLCSHSSPNTGINLSANFLELMNRLRDFNYKNIYKYWRIEKFKNYATTIIETIFDTLVQYYEHRDRSSLLDEYIRTFPMLFKYFDNWLTKYSDYNIDQREKLKFRNKLIYSFQERKSFLNALIDFIASMTDHFAIRVFNEIVSF